MSNAKPASLLIGILVVFLAATSVAAGQTMPPKAQPVRACCGTHPYEVDGVEVTLISAERVNPNEITLRWRYQNTTGAPKDIGGSFHGMGSSEAFTLVWDAYRLRSLCV
jgi:hypothetical protein